MRLVGDSLNVTEQLWTRCTEMSKILCTWLREVCSCCSLTVLPGPAWVLLIYVLQRILLISVVSALAFLSQQMYKILFASYLSEE